MYVHNLRTNDFNNYNIYILYFFQQGVLKNMNLEDDLGTFNRHSNKKERSFIETNMRKISVMVAEFYQILKPRPSL